MKILVVEDNLIRIKFFIDSMGDYDLKILDDCEEAISALESEVFDIILLDNDLKDGGFGADVAVFLYEHPENYNNEATIIIYCLDTRAQKAMYSKLSVHCNKVVILPFGSIRFYEYFDLTNV